MSESSEQISTLDSKKGDNMAEGQMVARCEIITEKTMTQAGGGMAVRSSRKIAGMCRCEPLLTHCVVFLALFELAVILFWLGYLA